MTEIDTRVNTSHDPKWAPATRYIVGIGLVLAMIALFFAISGALTVVIAAVSGRIRDTIVGQVMQSGKRSLSL
jgi:hypothetical protein